MFAKYSKFPANNHFVKCTVTPSYNNWMQNYHMNWFENVSINIDRHSYDFRRSGLSANVGVVKIRKIGHIRVFGPRHVQYTHGRTENESPAKPHSQGTH